MARRNPRMYITPTDANHADVMNQKQQAAAYQTTSQQDTEPDAKTKSSQDRKFKTHNQQKYATPDGRIPTTHFDKNNKYATCKESTNNPKPQITNDNNAHDVASNKYASAHKPCTSQNAFVYARLDPHLK